MPNNENWTEIKSKGEFEVNPNKWKTLNIDYGYKNLNGVICFCWRI